MSHRITCPLCGETFPIRGLWTHLGMVHALMPPDGALDPSTKWCCACGEWFDTPQLRASHFRQKGRECVLTAMLGGVV